MTFLLIDEHNNHSYDFVPALSRNELIVVYPPSRGGKKLQWLLGIFKCLRKSKSGDTIVFVFDFQAVLAWWICRILRMRRRFVCVNLMLDKKNTMRNRLVSAMYRKALPAGNFRSTVTSPEYGNWLNRHLGTNVSYTLLRDVFHSEYEAPGGDAESDVFCGGRNGRDWDLMAELASSMPDVSFTFVTPDSVAAKLKQCCSGNVRVLCNISETEFLSHMASSRLVCLPLCKQAPAGLIVMFQAAANHKPVLTSDTVTTSSYFAGGRGMILPRDAEKWRLAIKYCLDNQPEAAAMAERMLDFCEQECSPGEFVRTLDCLIDESSSV